MGNVNYRLNLWVSYWMGYSELGEEKEGIRTIKGDKGGSIKNCLILGINRKVSKERFTSWIQIWGNNEIKF